ncbi:tRNA (adenosine(37)-N6)-dimethylallyltransferase MiaA [soil metagenome]
MRPFYIVGPTAAGKSELAAAIAQQCNGEIVSADAFQVYAGLHLLTAKPEAVTLRMVPHHLIGSVSLGEEMNVGRFRPAALTAIEEIEKRGKAAFVVGGSGLYVQALTHGLSRLPPADPQLREELNALSTTELVSRLEILDGATAQTIDRHNRHRVLRAVEICLLSGQPASALRRRGAPPAPPAGVLVWRERAELFQRIDARVTQMFASGVVEEVREVPQLSATAAKTLGLHDIQELLAGRMAEAECIARIQQATRRYAKRQLTWFRRQSNFEPLNLSLHTSSEAIDWIARKARLTFSAQQR